MTQTKIEEKESLPKWPSLIVVGESVSPEIAGEIIIKTTLWDLMRYDYKNIPLYQELKKIYISSLPEEDRISPIEKIDFDYIQKKISPLELSYLYNDRIDSSWVNGLHGWINWDGTIFCNNYNIGKWPTIEEIESDLQLIINHFPFLKFTLQLVSISYEDDNLDKPLITYEINNSEIKKIKKDSFIYSFDKEYNYDIEKLGSWYYDKDHIQNVCNNFKKFLLI